MNNRIQQAALVTEHANCGSAVLNTIVTTLQTGSIAATDDRIDLEVDRTAKIIRLHAISTGSTCKSDFVIEQIDDIRFSATRINPDVSRRKPFQVTFDYDINDLVSTGVTNRKNIG